MIGPRKAFQGASAWSLRLNLTQHGETHQVNLQMLRLGLATRDLLSRQCCNHSGATLAGTGNFTPAVIDPVVSSELIGPSQRAPCSGLLRTKRLIYVLIPSESSLSRLERQPRGWRIYFEVGMHTES